MMSYLVLPAILVWAAWSWRDKASILWSGKSAMGTTEKREEAVAAILRAMQAHAITLEDLASAQKTTSPAQPSQMQRGASNVLMRVFTHLGGLFVLGGIGAYVGMFWPVMPSSMRIFMTLGVGFGIFVFSIVAMKENKYPRIILPLIILAAVIETTGWFVFLDEMFVHSNDVRPAACIVFGIMALQEWAVFVVFRRAALLFFAVFFTYGFLSNALSLTGMPEEYAWMLLGGSLLCVSHWTARTRYAALSEIGYFISAFWFNAGLYDFTGSRAGWAQGAIAVGISLCSFAFGLRQSLLPRLAGFFFLLGSAIFYGGLFDWVKHTYFELLYLAAAIAMMYGSTLLESRAILVTSTLAILGFIGYYTQEYFVHSIGWPIALILMGAAFLAVGAIAVRLSRRATSGG